VTYALFSLVRETSAQVMVSATSKPASLVICAGDGPFSLQIANTTGSTMSGATLLLALPPGVRYTPGSIVGATESNITNLNQPIFLLPDIQNNTAHTVTYNAGLVCGYTNTQNFTYTVTYNSNNYTGTDTPLQSYFYPEPVITNITNAAAVIPVNTTVTRNITVQQQGVNSTLDTLYILDEHTSDIQIISISIGVLHPYVGVGPLRVDTIILTGADLPGGNNLFDASESVIVGETVKLVGCTNGQSTVKAAWGCFKQICNFYSAFPSVSAAPGTTVLNMSLTNNNLGWGFIDNRGWIEFTITNNGTGAGTAFDLMVLSGFSSGGGTYFPNWNWLNKIDSFSVNGHSIKANYNFAPGALNGQYAWYTTLQFPFDPDGSGIGLEDSDNDGFFDDLPVGHTVTIRAHTYYDWIAATTSIPTGNACGYGWTNNSWQAFRFGYNYQDQCKSASGINWIPNGNLLLFQTYNTTTIQHTIPPDLYNSVPVWMEQIVSTSTVVTAAGCPHDSVFYRLILPSGVIIAPGTATFNGISMGAPDIHNDTVYYHIPSSLVLSDGNFRVPLMLNCSLPHPSIGSVQAELKFWCDKINYKTRYFTYWCSSSPVFGLQCPVAGNTDPDISVFKIQRTTLGWTDNHLTSKVTKATPGINLTHAMSRDSICIEAAGKINGPVDSLYFSLSHTNLGGGWGNLLFFTYLTDTLFYFNQATSTWHTCANLNPVITNGATPSLVTYFGDLTKNGNCLGGFTFSTGDSIRYVIYGRVQNLAQSFWQTVPALRASFYWIDGKTKKYQNDLGTTFNVLGTNYGFAVTTFYQQIVLQGCTSFQYEGLAYMSMESCGGDIAFPNEVRPYLVLDTLTFTLPEGFEYQPGSALHSYNVDNSYTSPTELIPDPIINTGPGGTHLIFIRGPSWSYSAYYDCWYDFDRITFFAVPSCKATGNYNYGMDAKGRYQFYADKQGIRWTTNGSEPVSYTPPLVDLTPLITTAEGRTDTVLWTVRLCNSRSFAANNNWLAFESGSNGIHVTDVTDITNLPVTVPVTINSYGPGKTWAELGTFAGNSCHLYRIRAIYTSCSFDSLKVRNGYNCAGYPMNPELGYAPSGYQCTENDAYLYLDPKEVSLNLLITSPANPVNLCDTLIYESLVTNSQLSTANNLKLTVTLPPGSTILSGQSQFKFPYTTGSYIAINDPVNIPAGSDKWVYNISSDPHGVFLLKGVDSVPKNGYKLLFKLQTDCNYISGTSLMITAQASNACSDIKTRTSYTEPVLINGLPTNVNLYVISTLTDPAFYTCDGNSNVHVKVINLGPDNISNIEKIGITIDDAYDYVNGSLVNIHNGPSGIGSNTVTGGSRYIRFSIQPNLTVNDSIVFNFQLHDVDPGSLTCDTLTMQTTTLLVGKVYCSVVSGDSCVIQSITASVLSPRPVIKDHVDFSHFYTANSIPNGSSGETVTVHFNIINTGTEVLRTTNLTVLFVHDANNNGLPDETGSDSLGFQNVNVTGLLPGDSIGSVAVFMAPASQICKLLAGLRLNENVCTCSDVGLPISNIHLVDAGRDTVACKSTGITIGTSGIAGYSYIWIPSTYLNSNTLPDPVFTYSGLLTQPDTLTYQLITTRIGNCISRDTMKVIVYPGSVSMAGPDTTVCSGFSTHLVNTATQYNISVHWLTAGNGTFDNPDILHPVYTPGSTDVMNGFANLSLISIGPCTADTDGVRISYSPTATANAGPDTTICQQFTYTITNATASHNSSVAWTTTGDGSFSSLTTLATVYTPGTGDITAGFVNLVLSATGFLPCLVVHDTMKLSFRPPPSLTNNPLNQSVCSQDSLIVHLITDQPLTTFSWTAALGSGTVTGFSNGSGNTIRQVLLNPANVAGSVIYTITPERGGCIGQNFLYTANIKPLPSVTNFPPAKSICNSAFTSIDLASTIPLTTFSWTATSGFPQITGYGSGSGSTISQQLFNSSFINGSAVYHITPINNGCTGSVANYTATVFPVPDVYFNPDGQSICSRSFSNINLLSHVTGSVFFWTASSFSPNITGYSSGAGNSINQQLFNSGTLPDSATYHVSPMANSCPGTPGNVSITVKPLPPVTFTPCNDRITTTNARPFVLKGGTPLGGTYSGAGVNSMTGIFTPSLAGTGNHAIVYAASNHYLCSDEDTLILSVISPVFFACDDPVTDVRDNKTYPTIHIGTQCWMAANLDHGSPIASTLVQRDNCILEKYCFNDNLANCTSNGGLYQWDELMQYQETEGLQGLCPPEWHIPSLNDWNTLFSVYINNAFAGAPLLYSGYSGFNALLTGAHLVNTKWAFQGFATFFWTSTSHTGITSWAHGINQADFSVSLYPSNRSNAFSVRCIKD
jgi:uncharacterized protein (TIGR02145 family)